MALKESYGGFVQSLKDSLSVFGILWQTLKDTWEELYQIIIVNLAWFCLVIVIPVLLLSIGHIATFWLAVVIFVVGCGTTLPGVYACANRVARGKTFHFSDAIEGIKTYWKKGLLWMLANVIVYYILYMDLVFVLTDNPSMSWATGTTGLIMFGLFAAILIFWSTIQIYFWPMLINQEEPKITRAWRNSALLILSNPFFAFFVVLFTLVLSGISIALLIPMVFIGVMVVAIFGSGSVLQLLMNLGYIDEVRPKSLG